MTIAAPPGTASSVEIIVWRIAAGQRLLFEDFDDGVVMFDTRVGSTHLLNATSADALAILQAETPLTAEAIHSRLLERLELSPETLPLIAVEQLLGYLDNLGIVSAGRR